MPVKKALVVEWSAHALKQSAGIRNYLVTKFSEKEVAGFYELLISFESTVARFPDLYSIFSVRKKLRRAVLNKNLSVYYTSTKTKIFVVSVLDNRMDYSKLI